jgi:hypothetical protein
LFGAGTLLAAGAGAGGAAGLFFACCSFWQPVSVKTIRVNPNKKPVFDAGLKYNGFIFASPLSVSPIN